MKLFSHFNGHVKLVPVFLTLILLGLPCRAESLDWKSLHETADRLTLEDARSNWEKQPDSIDAMYIYALKNLMTHREDEAEKIFQAVLERDPGTLEAVWGLAEIAQTRHRYAQAQKLAQRVIREYPEFPPPYITLAYIHYIHLNLDESLQQTAKVINMEKGHVDKRNLVYAHGLYSAVRGLMAYYSNPIYKAVNGYASLRHLRKVRELDDESFVYYLGWGSFYTLAPKLFGGDLDKAESYLKKAIEIDPLQANAYVRLAQIYQKKGNREKFEKNLNRALEIDPLNEVALDVKHGTCRFLCLDEDNWK